MNVLNDNLIKKVSKDKQEPKWMLDFRLKALESFHKQENPVFGPKLDIDFNKFTYYKKSKEVVDDWNKVDCAIKDTFQELGVISAEEDYLSGVANQVDSNVIYNKNKNEDGVIFLSTDDALKQHPLLFKKYFNTLVKYDENKYTALDRKSVV